MQLGLLELKSKISLMKGCDFIIKKDLQAES